MKKDTLTIEKIKLDFTKKCTTDLKEIIILPIILALIVLFIIYVMWNIKNSVLFFVLGILLSSPLIFYIYCCLLGLSNCYKQYKIIKSDSFKIVTDKLVGKEEKNSGYNLISSLRSLYYLHFSSYGRYSIFYGENYSSSELYAMNDVGVFNYSDIGDTFYLIIDKKETILLAYNTKLFELVN